MDRYINAGGLRFHILNWGQMGNPPLLLLHGLASGSRMFDLIAPALSLHFHVIAVDLRGHGLSDKPDYGYDFPTIASDIDNIVDALGFKDTPLTIIGHSWGAYITLYYAATRPTRVAKAVLLDGGTRPLNAVYATWEEAQVEMAPPEYNHTTLQEIKRRIYEDWLGAYFRPEHEPLALAMFDLSDPHNVHAHLSRENHMQIAYHLWSFHPLDYYIRVQCPVLIVNAIHPGQSMDSEMLTYTREAEIHLQRVEVFWMQDTIHDIPWHRPTELLGILQGFLPG